MSIIDNSIKLAFDLYPERRKELAQKTWHFAFAYRRSKLLAIGQNDMREMNPKTTKLFSYFSIHHPYHYQHAETDVISKLWGKLYIDNTIKFVLIRINKYGELGNSKPCKRCQTIFDALSVSKIYYSASDGQIIEPNNSLLKEVK